MRKIVELERKRTEAMKLEMAEMERRRRQEEHDTVRQRRSAIEFQRAKRAQDNYDKQARINKVLSVRWRR